MPNEVKILICRPPFPPLTDDEVKKEDAFKFVQNLVESLKKDHGWTVQASNAPPTYADQEKEVWHEFKLVRGPLHDKHGL